MTLILPPLLQTVLHLAFLIRFYYVLYVQSEYTPSLYDDNENYLVAPVRVLM